jgi:hypothetical protein
MGNAGAFLPIALTADKRKEFTFNSQMSIFRYMLQGLK